jgi:hypothetical protein
MKGAVTTWKANPAPALWAVGDSVAQQGYKATVVNDSSPHFVSYELSYLCYHVWF